MWLPGMLCRPVLHNCLVLSLQDNKNQHVRWVLTRINTVISAAMCQAFWLVLAVLLCSSLWASAWTLYCSSHCLDCYSCYAASLCMPDSTLPGYTKLAPCKLRESVNSEGLNCNEPKPSNWFWTQWKSRRFTVNVSVLILSAEIQCSPVMPDINLVTLEHFELQHIKLNTLVQLACWCCTSCLYR